MTPFQVLHLRTEFTTYLTTLENKVTEFRELAELLPTTKSTIMLAKAVAMQDILIDLYKIYLGKVHED